MKTFRGYVSKAQEGILSENPDSREFDSTPTLGEARDRAGTNTLAWSLREEDMGEKGATVSHTQGLELAQSHASPREGRPGPYSDMPSIPTGDFRGDAPKRGARLFSARSLLVALVVNLCLIAAFLFVLKLERGSDEVVFYIDLADNPDGKPGEVTAGEEMPGEVTTSEAMATDALDSVGNGEGNPAHNGQEGD